MTLTNAYGTSTTIDYELFPSGSPSVAQQARRDDAGNAAARMIDKYTGRKFWQDATVQTREFFADDPYCLDSQFNQVLDISTATGLIVKLDDTDLGTFATTLTITTDFVLTPPNAIDEDPDEPYTGIRLVSGYSFPMSTSGRPGVQVTAKFGFATVPDPIARAWAIQTLQLYKAGDATFGILSFGDGGGGLRVRGINPQVAALCDPFCLPRVG